MQELRPDAAVQPDAAGDVLHIGTDFLAQIGNLVDEGDLHRQEGVAGIFDQFRSAACREHERRLVEIERPIDFRHHLSRATVAAVDPDDDPVGPFEILDRGTFPQEFRVGDDGDVSRGIGLADDALDLVSGTDRNRRLGHHDGEALKVGGDFACSCVNIGKIRMPVTAP